MPVERRACGGFLKVCGRGGLYDAERDINLFYMGPAVSPREQMSAMNYAWSHFFTN